MRISESLQSKLLHSKFETGENSVWFQTEDTSHLACHAETTNTALLRAITQAQATTTIGVDEVGDKTFFAQCDFT